MIISIALRHALNVVSPSLCASCGKKPASYPFPICLDCASEVLSSASPLAAQAGAAIKVHSCLEYTPPVRACLKSFKFNGNSSLADFFHRIIRSYILHSGLRKEKFDLIIPVPLHVSRKRKRGYNQSDLIAAGAASSLSAPLKSGLLVKTRNTPPQSGLGKKERSENLRGSFAVSDPSLVKGRTILLVDDIMTTGATVEECSSTLERCGSSMISALTLARVF